MKLLRTIGVVVLFLFLSPLVRGATYPQPVGYVNDFASLLTPETRTRLEENLAALEKNSGHEVSVVTIETLAGDTVENYAVELFEAWQIGKKGSDNGVLLLVAKEEREIRIEVGYGLEPVLTDGKAGDIIRNVIVPRFRSDEYDQGIEEGTNALVTVIGGGDPPAAPSPPLDTDAIGPLLIFGFVILNMFASYVAGFLGRTKAIWPGGVIGGVLGFIGGNVLSSAGVGIAGAIVFGIIGLILDAVLSRNYKERVKRGLPTGFGSSWGGFSSGRSSGGFGGFGGGRSGGGGASGRW